ncbi:hypothetical protein JCM10207_006115 [Rhodosporidiobolus poonsookiae]
MSSPPALNTSLGKEAPPPASCQETAPAGSLPESVDEEKETEAHVEPETTSRDVDRAQVVFWGIVLILIGMPSLGKAIGKIRDDDPAGGWPDLLFAALLLVMGLYAIVVFSAQQRRDQAAVAARAVSA